MPENVAADMKNLINRMKELTDQEQEDIGKALDQRTFDDAIEVSRLGRVF